MHEDGVALVDHVVDDAHDLADLSRLAVADDLVRLVYMRVALVPRVGRVLDAVADPHVRQATGAQVHDPADPVVRQEVHVLRQTTLPSS